MKIKYKMLWMLLIYLLILLVVYTDQSLAQSCWVYRKSNDSHSLLGIYFSDSLTGTAVGAAGTILHTTDGGKYWQRKTGSVPGILYRDVSFASPNIGFAVGNDTSFFPWQPILFHTTDDGKTWSQQTTNATYLYAVSFANLNVGMLVGPFTILWTTNGGDTWTSKESGAVHNITTGYCVNSNTAFIASSGGKILRTTDAGATWTDLSVDHQPFPYFYTGAWFFDSTSGILIDRYGTTLKTTNAGMMWTEQDINAEELANIVFADINDGMIVGGGVFSTTNAGSTWQEVQYPVPSHVFVDVAFPTKNINSPVFVGYDGSSGKGIIVQRSDNCSPYPPISVVLPSNGVTQQVFNAVSSSLLTLEWDCLPLVTVVSSHVQVALDSTFGGTLIADTNVALNSSLINTSLAHTNFISGMTYYWRVRIMFIDSTLTNWSDTWSFTMAKSVINGSVFEDLNRDGIQNNGEQNLSGRDVNITGGAMGSVVTDVNGAFSLWGLAPGQYTVEALFPASWVVSTPQSASYNITLGASDTASDNIFGGYFPWNSAGGIVFNDRNDNGIKESWEEGLPNWKIVRGGISADSTYTDSLGQYNFYPLVLGTYTLSTEIQPTWEQISPRFNAPNNVNFNDYDQHPTGVNFAIHKIPERIKLTLTVQDNITPIQRDIWFGQHPGTTFGIWGVDAATTNYDYSEGEAELPPLSNTFEARFVTPKSFNNQFGLGSWIDMRGFTSVSQVDSYKVSFRPGNPSSEAYSFTLSWSTTEINASYSGAVTMIDRYNNSTDMKTQNSRTITDPTVNYVLIITHNPLLPQDHIKSWQMISLPYDVSNKQVTANFPSAISQAFSYNPASGYQTASELAMGTGYWLKYSPGLDPIPTNGPPLTADTIDVSEGWNLMGSIASTINVSTISSIPSGIVTSQFFGYNGAYYTSTTIEPGKAYWVKVSQAGQLILSSSEIISAMNRIRIIPTSEQPPSPPDGAKRSHHPTIPSEFFLEQNYPNPFNPTTDFRFQIAPARLNDISRSGGDYGLVTLKVYDVLGREVATIVHEELPLGTYTRTWDAGSIVSGVYFYRLSAVGQDGILFYTNVKKMVLLR